ncbi:MAG TPA: hypothetical protein VGE97_09660 [Nitrososphaera sp.]
MLVFIRRIILALIVALVFGISAYAQTTDRIKIYIKIESSQAQDKIASSLRSRLKPYKKHFLFVFPGAQVENNPALTFMVKELAADPRWVEVYIIVNGVNGGAALFYLETQSEDLAKHILMFSYLKARSLEVGEDQAREEFQSILQEGYEEAERMRKQKNGANTTRTKTIKKL